MQEIYGTSGCVETGAFGNEAYILTGYFNIPKVFELTLNNGYDKVSKKAAGLQLLDMQLILRHMMSF